VRSVMKIHFNQPRLSFTDKGQVWFEVPLAGGWAAAYRIFLRDDEILVAEMRVFPLSEYSNDRRPGEWNVNDAQCPEHGITARLLNTEVVLGEHIHELLRETWHNLAGSVMELEGGSLEDQRMAEKFAAWFRRADGGFLAELPTSSSSRRGPKGEPIEYYAKLARDYVRKCEEGRSPVKALAKARNMKVSTARAALNRARNRGLLTRQKQGRAGGQLTKSATRVLSETARDRRRRRKS